MNSAWKKIKRSTKLKVSQSWLMSLSCTMYRKKSYNCRTDSCHLFLFVYNGNYKYEQGFNKKLTISHTVEAKKAFNST